MNEMNSDTVEHEISIPCLLNINKNQYFLLTLEFCTSFEQSFFLNLLKCGLVPVNKNSHRLFEIVHGI